MKGRGNLNLKRGSLVLVSTTAPGGSSPRRGGGSGQREANRRGKRSLLPLGPILSGCQPLKSKTPSGNPGVSACSVTRRCFARSMRDAPETRQAKSGTTNMPPLTRFDSSSKLDSKSNRRKHQTNTGRGFKHTAQGRGAGAGRRARRAVPPARPASPARGICPCSCQTNSLEPPSFKGPNWQRAGDHTGTRTRQEAEEQEQRPPGSPRQSQIRGRGHLTGNQGGPEQREVGKQGPLTGPGDDHCLQASQARKSCGANPAPGPWSPTAQQRRGQAPCRRHPHPELAPDDARPPQKSRERR